MVRNYRWEHPGQFPTFEKGTAVTLDKNEDADFLGWYPCEIKGYKPYIPIEFVSNGKLTRDYNPTELIQELGDILEVKEIVHSWLLATNKANITGWIPAECVVSII